MPPSLLVSPALRAREDPGPHPGPPSLAPDVRFASGCFQRCREGPSARSRTSLRLPALTRAHKPGVPQSAESRAPRARFSPRASARVRAADAPAADDQQQRRAAARWLPLRLRLRACPRPRKHRSRGCCKTATWSPEANSCIRRGGSLRRRTRRRPARRGKRACEVTTGNRGYFVSNKPGSPMNTGLGSLTEVTLGSQDPIGYPMGTSAVRSGKQKTPSQSGFPNGETRTRTGDTTIFSGGSATEARPISRDFLAVGGRWPSPRFPAFSARFPGDNADGDSRLPFRQAC